MQRFSVQSVPKPRNRWSTRVLIPAAIFLATAGLLGYAAKDALQPRLDVHVAAAIPKASAVVATRGPDASDSASTDRADAPLGAVLVQAPGWVEPNPFSVSVPALAEGVIESVPVLEGDHVEAGQVVARMISQDAQLALRAAEGLLAERAADVERARTALATAQLQVEVERLAADELRDEVDRNRKIAGTAGVSAGDFRRMEIRLGGLETRVHVAEQMVAESKAMLAQAQAAHDSAMVAKDQAALTLSRMEIRSPIAGVVLARMVEPGSRISMTSEGGDAGKMGVVLRVYDPGTLQVRVDVPLADAAKVGLGSRAQITTEALPDDTFTGVIVRVVHEANIQRNTVQFKVAIDHPSRVLKPEMLTRVKLYVRADEAGQGVASGEGASVAREDGEAGQVLLIPQSAVVGLADGKGQVWLVEARGDGVVAREREITCALSRDAGFLEVSTGLQLSDRVVIDPPTDIHDGMRLRVLDDRAASPTEPPAIDS